jgi:hypothetical protein
LTRKTAKICLVKILTHNYRTHNFRSITILHMIIFELYLVNRYTKAINITSKPGGYTRNSILDLELNVLRMLEHQHMLQVCIPSGSSGYPGTRRPLPISSPFNRIFRGFWDIENSGVNYLKGDSERLRCRMLSTKQYSCLFRTLICRKDAAKTI